MESSYQSSRTPFLNFKEFKSDIQQITDQTQSFINFIQALSEFDGTGYVPKGKYLIAQPIKLALDFDLKITLHPEAEIIGGNFAQSIISFDGKQNRRSIMIQGGVFNTSNTIHIAAVGSGSALSLKRVDNFHINGTTFKAEENYISSQNNLHGDSGITTVDCKGGTIENCLFVGHPDIGIYLSGNINAGTKDDGGLVTIKGNRFLACANGVSCKRQVSYVQIIGNSFENCAIGVSMFPAGGNQISGSYNIVSNNNFTGIAHRGIEIRGGMGCVINGNIITDTGIDILGNAHKSATGIRLLGAKDCIINGNLLKQGRAKHRTNPRATAIKLNDGNTGKSEEIAENNNICANRIDGFGYGIREMAGCGENFYSSNAISNSNKYDFLAATSSEPLA